MGAARIVNLCCYNPVNPLGKDAFLDSDSAYKAIFSHPRVVRDLLQGFVNEPWVDELDFTTLHKLNNAYVADDGSKRFNDTVWRVKFKDDWLYVCLMLEFQSSNDAFDSARLKSLGCYCQWIGESP